MANSALTGLTAVTVPAGLDKVYLVDVSDVSDSGSGSSRQITLTNLFAEIGTINTNIVTLTGTQTLTNKTLTSAIMTTPQINDTSADHQYVFAVSELAADRTITLPLLTGADTFVFADFIQTLTNKTLTTPTITNPTVSTGVFTSPVFAGTPDLNGVEFIIDADADTSITADTDDQIDYKLGGSDRFRMKTSDLDLVTATANIQVAGADVKRGFYVPASAMTPSTTLPCADLVQIESATNDVNIRVLDFDGAGTAKESAEFGIQSPTYWDAGTVTAQFTWYATAGSGTVNWECQGVAFSDDDALDAAYGTLQEVTDTLLATGDVHITAETAAITIAGTPVAGDWLNFRVNRDPANDTNTSDARLMGIRIRFSIAQYNDA